MVVADSCTCSRYKWRRAERRRSHNLETIALTTFAYFYVKPWNKNLENKTAVSTLHSTGRKFILKRTYRRQEKIKVLREKKVIYSVRISANWLLVSLVLHMRGYYTVVRSRRYEFYVRVARGIYLTRSLRLLVRYCSGTRT